MLLSLCLELVVMTQEPGGRTGNARRLPPMRASLAQPAF